MTYVLDYLVQYDFEEVVLSVGYKHEVISKHFGDQYKNIKLSYYIEEEPLGTGGAILQAAGLLKADEFLALNGDSLFKVDLSVLDAFARNKQADVVLSLKSMENIDRYGIVETDDTGRILAFKEKQRVAEGTINGGVYWLSRKAFFIDKFPQKFSFEKDLLERYTTNLKMYGCLLEGYFIDIGIPMDYAKAQLEVD